MLTDTGPLIALLDDDDKLHQNALSILKRMPTKPLLTTWPCFAEASYLLNKVGGYDYQNRLWEMRRKGKLNFLDLTSAEVDLMDRLMSRYRDVPMDLADASIVAIASSRKIRKVFTFDSDFYVYRLEDGTALEVIR